MTKNIFLLSDQVIHWNIVPAPDRQYVYWESWGDNSIKKCFDVLKTYFNQAGSSIDWSLIDIDYGVETAEKVNPTNDAINHVFATWGKYTEGKDKVWRIREIVHVGRSVQPDLDESAFQRMHGADLVILRDWGMHIRHFEISGLAELLQDKWAIYRVYPPIFEDNLWQEFQKGAGSKKIILLRADDLRRLNTSISKGLSWEQTIQDILNEIYFKRNISLHPLRTMQYVIISFGCTGSMLIHNHPNDQYRIPDIQFFFDAMEVEGCWEESHPGYLPGDLELLAALLAKEILYLGTADDVQIGRAVRAHLLARRALIIAGANVEEGSLPLHILPSELSKVYGPNPTQDFTPVNLDYALFQSLFETRQNGISTKKDWSLLGMTKWDLYSLARQIALHGPMKALQGWNIPIAKYNYLVTVDRKEIEFLQNLRSLISEYLQNKSSQPLSIAVFGPPGSGKSFSIKQLAKALDLPDQEIADVTFNLSQFNEDDPTDLHQAFHVVRDISLSGKTPLVFWDEFDSKDLAWLRYFLAPMQDGEFQEGQLTHSIGKSIFVFAGGTCSCMEEFEEKANAAISEKGPDFLSRIKGYINIMGPNPVLPYADRNNSQTNLDDEISQLDLA